jgi:hypothetical protein
VRWGHDEDGFKRRLAEIDPLQFYTSSLHSLAHESELGHPLEESLHELFAVLQREKEWLIGQGLWPRKPTVLEDLLAPE